MTEHEALLVIWTVAAFVALGGRLLMLGAGASDLEMLIERKRNGLSRIEAVQHVRTEAQWVYVALVLIAVGLLQLVEVWWRGPVSRWLLVSVTVVMAITPIWDWIDRRRKLRLYIAEEQRSEVVATADLRADLESYRQMAEVAITNLERTSNTLRAERGEPPIDVVAPVVPEHSSPTTGQQQATAEIATKRARLVAAAKSLEVVSPETPTGEPAP